MLASSDGAEIVEAFREVPVSGWHVHGAALQQDAVRVVDDLGGRGRVNAIVRRADGSLAGEWVERPREQYELWRAAVSG